MNYIPEQNPTYVNNRIQEYIDTVMHPNCETGKDKWTVESMVSWERFGMTICRKCHDNRERAHYLIRNEYMPAYDRVCTLWLDRKTTPYRELPYEVRGSLESIGMHLYNTALSEYGISLFPHTAGWQSWDMDAIFNAGQYAFSTAGIDVKTSDYMTSQVEQECIKINSIINGWNAKVQKRKCDAMETRLSQMEAKLAEQSARLDTLTKQLSVTQ